MSAFILSENHIRAIVTGYLDMLARVAGCQEHEDCRATLELGIECAKASGKEVPAPPDASAIGQMLWNENHLSYAHRYPMERWEAAGQIQPSHVHIVLCEWLAAFIASSGDDPEARAAAYAVVTRTLETAYAALMQKEQS